MSILNVTLTLYTPDPSKDPRAESDPQVKHVEAQIQDWQTCPTTDPATKRQKLQPLISEVDSLKASIDKLPPPPSASDPSSSGSTSSWDKKGSTFDVLV